MKEKMIKERVSYIDVAKGLGILLIVFGHSRILSNGNSEIHRIVYSFHVPLFFFISGLFLNPNEIFWVFFIKKTDSLLKPYLVVLLALSIPLLVKGFSASKYIFGVLYGNGTTIIWPHLWFLPHLWILLIFSYIFVKITNFDCLHWGFRASLLLLLLVVGFNISRMYFSVSGQSESTIFDDFGKSLAFSGLPFSFDLAFITSFYFLLAYSLRSKVLISKYSNIYFLLSLFVFVFCHLFFDFSIDLNLRVYDNIFISTFQALSGIHIILSVSQLLSRSILPCRIFSYIGSGSLFILIFHSYLQNKVFSVINSLNINFFLIDDVIPFFVCSTVPLLMWEVAKRNNYLAIFCLPLNRRV